MKRLLPLLTAILLITLAGCKKDSNTLLNATSYIEDERAISNIAFIHGSYTPGSSEEAAAYFETNPPLSRQNVSQYSEYVPDGTYTILIYIPIGYMEGAYTYRRVEVPGGDGNVMEFTQSPNQRGYQPWKNKY